MKWEEPDEEGLIAVSPVTPVSDESVIPIEDEPVQDLRAPPQDKRAEEDEGIPTRGETS